MPNPGINPTPNTTPTFSRDWLNKAHTIRLAKQEYDKYSNIMTPYERQTVWGSIKEKIERDYTQVYQGAAADLNKAKQDYSNMVAARKKAAAQEINSWDNGKLGTELHAFQMRINAVMGSNASVGAAFGQPGAARLIEGLYREAQASGDRYKQRAAAEVLATLNTGGLPREYAQELAGFKGQVKLELESMRTTPEMLVAAEAEKKAVTELFSARELVRDVAEVMGDDPNNLFAVGGLVTLLKTVKVDQLTGEVKLYDMDSPEVTGIVWNPENLKEYTGDVE